MTVSKNNSKSTPDKPRKSRKEQAADTRRRLKMATRKLLEEVGYRQMRIADIAREAGVAAGLCYHYFPDLKSITCEVLADFMDDMTTDARQSLHGDDLVHTLRGQYLVLIEYFRRSPGLVQCMLQVSDEIPEFGDIWEQTNRRWTRSFARFLSRCMGESHPDPDTATLLAYSLGSMADALIHEFYIRKNSDLTTRIHSPEQLAELLVVLTYRAVFLRNPPADSVNQALLSGLHPATPPDSGTAPA